jgi:hypothetical protein
MNNEITISDHRKMLFMSGNLSDWQIAQLQNWPYVIFGQDLMENHFTYDFSGIQEGNAGTVEYVLFLQRETVLRELFQVDIDNLTLWVKSIFWQETEVKVELIKYYEEI